LDLLTDLANDGVTYEDILSQTKSSQNHSFSHRPASLENAPTGPVTLPCTVLMGNPQSDVGHKVFSGILKTDQNQLGVTHDLFSIGLNSGSLLAVQAAVVLARASKLNIGLNNFYLRFVCFRYPDIPWLTATIG
jgi:hypothetical protein